MRNRDYINEILSVKDRTEFYGRTELQSRFFDIDYALKEHLDYKGSFNNEILKYIPIATVACFESYFRTIISELIDNGEPFTNNVLNFNQTKSIKFDFNIVNAIQKEKITVGEFVAHFLSCNNLNDFNSNLSTIIGSDFIKSLKEFQPNQDRDLFVHSSENFTKIFPRLKQSVDRAFELRHIFCHEFATNVNIEYNNIKGIYDDCKIFLHQVNAYIWNLIEPDAPITQTEMNKKASEDFEKAEKRLNKVIKELKSTKPIEGLPSYDVNLLDKVIGKWKEFRVVKAEMESNAFFGGSMQPLIHLIALKNITEEMTENLERDLDVRKACH